MIRNKEHELIQLSDLELLGENCPRCFGPPVTSTPANEPDIIVCLDGNFQHRRHAAASVPIPGYDPPLPELFLPKAQWEDMAEKIGGNSSVNNTANSPDLDVVSDYTHVVPWFLS